MRGMSDSTSNFHRESIDKENSLARYEGLLATIWEQILPTLGNISVITIVKRAITLTQNEHPIIGYLDVTPDGLAFQRLREQLTRIDNASLLAAFQALIANLIDLLQTLTGNILRQKILEIVEQEEK
jgi:hypothetical protein